MTKRTNYQDKFYNTKGVSLMINRAHVLANMACYGGFSVILYEQCCAQVSSIYLTDVVGVEPALLI